MAQNVPDPAMLTENRLCPGCKQSVVTENGGVVVAFGQSYFHIDCFKCAKCEQQVTADTNLLLLSDGSPVCANCSYCCNVCGQPILDEAIMTGDDSYHAHCFNCKVCKKRIEELVFAKTSQGIYCMPCHSERVARSKRHLERKEREKRERERQAQAEAAAAYDAITSGNAGSNASSKANTPSNAPSSSARSGTPRTSDFATSHASSPTRPTEAAQPSHGSQQQHSASSTTSTPGTAPSVTSSTAHGAPQRAATLQNGLPSAPNQFTQHYRERDGAATPDHMRSTSSPLGTQDSLAVPSNGMQQALQKRRSFDDRPLNVVTNQNGSSEMSSSVPNQNGLLSPDAPTSRKTKRQSINPNLVMSFNNLPQGPSSPSTSPSTPHAPHMNGKPRSPLRDHFANDVRASPPTFTQADNRHSPSIPRMQLDTSDNLHDRHYTGRTRSASSSDTQRVAQHNDMMQRERSRSPMRLSITLDRVPARTSSRAELRSDTAPPNFAPEAGRRTPQLMAEGRASPSLNVPNGSPMARQMSLDNRHRTSTSSLGQTIELPPRSGSTSRPTSPAHKVDVPHGIESGTDTEAEGEEEFHAQKESVRESLPPLPPPKETKGPKAGMRPPQLKLDSSHARDEEHDDLAQVDSADVSEDYLHDEVPVESTSHSTFIAPALPPIRFSMGGADFAELLKSVGGPEGLNALDKIAEGQLPVTPPPTAAQPSTPTSRRPSLTDATPVQRREPPINRSQSPHSIAVTSPSEGAARPSIQRSQSSDPPRDGRAAKPRYEDQTVYKRERVDSSASLPPNGRAHITLTTPDNTTSSIARPDTSDLVRRRLQEALNESIERGAAYVKLDPEFIGAIIMLLNQRQEEFIDMKRKLDGMKRASQQYVEGLTVAQTEYDKELKARRDAEAEVTRLRVLLSSQAVRLKAMSGDTKKQEVQRQLSQEMTESLSSLERDLSKLKVERDMTLAEVEELSASKSSNSLSDANDTARLSKALSIRFDSIKNQYQNDLLPLTAQREALLREITELRASRDAYLEETTMLSARNEELAQLHAQYLRRMDVPDGVLEPSGRDSSLDKARPQGMPASATSSTAVSEESVDQRYVKVNKTDAIETQTPQPRGKFKWPGYRAQPAKDHAPHMSESSKPKPRIEHNFQQVNGLRVARCDHCGDKMWGSIMRCGACNVAVHHRCLQLVHLPCSQHVTNGKDDRGMQPPPGPSMFGRDLTEQVRADSKDEERLVPVIVEKCIDAVDTLALDYEGIYRKTGGSGQSKIITQLFERGDYSAFDLRDNDRFNDICSVTSVLKTYFRSLPDPLLTYNLHDRFIYAASLKDPAQKSQAFTELVAELPKEHYYTTRALMLHLHRIAQRSDKNLMHARNLGVVFGPTLMRSRDPNAEFSDMAGKALSVEWLVENAPIVFEQHTADSP